MREVGMIPKELQNADYLEHIDDLRRYWKANPPKTSYSAKQWIELYPELKSDFNRLLLESESKQGKLIGLIKRKLKNSKTLKSPYDLIEKELITEVEGKDLVETENRINWFRLGLLVKKTATGLTEDQIQTAREYPVVDLIESKRIKDSFCCPFHEEKTPSFHVYKDNHWYCFGCGKHGQNAIDFVVEKQKLTFTEAVRFLGGAR